MEAQIRHAARRRGYPRASIIAALRGVGIEPTDRRDPAGASPLPLIIFFDSVDDGLLAEIRTASQNGRIRVAAVGLGDTPAPSDTWRVLQAGASDVLAWNADDSGADELAVKLTRWSEIDGTVFSAPVRETLVGGGPDWVVLLREIVEVGRYTDASVLITGESGTGKELVARLIHDLDARPEKGDLVVVDCTTVVPTLSGSEFFGHEKGAFTGAVSTRDGAFALAHGGTLFLDEVGDLPLPLQAELLRVIQERMYKRVGSDTWRRTDFRLIAATNRDLAVEKAAGRFRSDLFYRIAEWQFHMPALRERVDDIPLLARAFLRTSRPSGDLVEFDAPVLELIKRREYPGNVRDLRLFVNRIAKRHVGPGRVTAGDVPPEERHVATETQQASWDDDRLRAGLQEAIQQRASLREITHRTADVAMELALAAEGGSVPAAARRLGVTPRALQLRRAAQRSGRGSLES